MDTAEYKHIVQSEEFVAAHGGRTWKLAKLNLAIRSIDAQIAHCFTFHNDRHPNLKGPSPALLFGA